jgi:hypothetical protein
VGEGAEVGRRQEEKNERKTHDPPVVDLRSLVVSDPPSEQPTDNLRNSVHEVEATCRKVRVSMKERSREEKGQTDALRLLVFLVPRGYHADQDRRDDYGEGTKVRTGGRKEKKRRRKGGREEERRRTAFEGAEEDAPEEEDAPFGG